MSIPGKLQLWLDLSLRKILQEAAVAESLTLPLQLSGTRVGQAEAETEEWMAYHVIEYEPLPSRNTEVFARLMLQVSFFSRFAEDRADGQTARPWELAGRVCNRIQKRFHIVKNYDEQPITEQALLYLGDPKLSYQDESKQYQPSSTSGQPINIHSVIAKIDGNLRRGL